MTNTNSLQEVTNEFLKETTFSIARSYVAEQLENIKNYTIKGDPKLYECVEVDLSTKVFVETQKLVNAKLQSNKQISGMKHYLLEYLSTEYEATLLSTIKQYLLEYLSTEYEVTLHTVIEQLMDRSFNIIIEDGMVTKEQKEKGLNALREELILKPIHVLDKYYQAILNGENRLMKMTSLIEF